MLSASHELIAQEVYKVIETELYVSLDYSNLLNGSTLPDRHVSMAFLPHCKKESFNYVKKLIKKLAASSIPCSEADFSLFSLNLGIVIHFISDYFCAYHNGAKYFNPLTHYIYEFKLERLFRNYFRSDLCLKRVGIEIVTDMEEFIEKQHNEYNRAVKSMQADILYSIHVSAVIALYIVSACFGIDRSTYYHNIAFAG